MAVDKNKIGLKNRKTDNVAFALSKDSYQTGHLSRLISLWCLL